MEQKDFLRNISGTACLVSIALSAMSMNTTMVINGDYKIPDINYSVHDFAENASKSYGNLDNNHYEINSESRLMAEAEFLFGTMRDATPEEQDGVNKYIRSISKDMGVNFFDLC